MNEFFLREDLDKEEEQELADKEEERPLFFEASSGPVAIRFPSWLGEKEFACPRLFSQSGIEEKANRLSFPGSRHGDMRDQA